MNYHFSKDYELLWQLAQKQEVICTNGKMLLITKMKGDNIVIVENDGGIWSESDCKHHFKRACEYYEIQFLIPGEVSRLVMVLKEIVNTNCIIRRGRGIEKAKEILKKYEVSND